MVNGVRRAGRLLQPPSLNLFSTIIIFLINTDLIFPPPFVLPPTVAGPHCSNPSRAPQSLSPRELWRNLEEGCKPITRDVGPSLLKDEAHGIFPGHVGLNDLMKG